MSASTLDVVPHLTRWGTASTAEPPDSPFAVVYGYTTLGQAIARAGTDDYPAWLEHVRPAAGCTRPIRLAGTITTHDPATGAVVRHLDTAALPDGVIYKACGNRRATVCPACAEVYQHDAYHLLHAGLVGGKSIPTSVAEHPAVFATFTAPSFGPVHTRVVRRHTCTNRRRCQCRAEPCHARRDTPARCTHGRAAVCYARHEPGDAVLGQPLCPDCYDHDHQVVFNYFAGELWRRTKQAIERHLARIATVRGISPHLVRTPSGRLREASPVRLSHGKVAEFQIRGAVHFHVLLRLDGLDPTDPTAIVPPPAAITGEDLAAAIRQAATVSVRTPAHSDQPAGWLLGWGSQLDIRHLHLGGGEVDDAMAAAYLAKYATKATETTGHRSARLTLDTVDQFADPDGDHTARLIDACWRLGRPDPAATIGPWTCPTCHAHTRMPACPSCTRHCQGALDTQPPNERPPNPYAGLRRWAHMLGFGGHFLTKARHFSITFGILRATRTTYRRTHPTPTDVGGDPATPTTTGALVAVATLSFAGLGWHTSGDALLANTAAALARERRTAARDELSHTIAPTAAGTPPTGPHIDQPQEGALVS